MPNIEEVEKAIDRLNSVIDDTVARIHAGYLLIETMKQQLEAMRQTLNELKQMKQHAEKYK